MNLLLLTTTTTTAVAAAAIIIIIIIIIITTTTTTTIIIIIIIMSFHWFIIVPWVLWTGSNVSFVYLKTPLADLGTRNYICSGISSGRVLSGELYTVRF